MNIKRSTKKRLRFYAFHIPVLFLFAFLTLFMLRASYGAYLRFSYAEDKKEIMENKYDTARRRKDEIEKRLKQISSDFGKEYIIRHNFNLSKKGEYLIIMNDENKIQEKSGENSDDESGFDFFGLFK